MTGDEPQNPLKLSDISTTWRRLHDPLRFTLTYGPAMRRYLLAILGDEHDADDVLQGILLQVTERGFATFDPALRLSPSVRRLLMETGLDPTGLKGQGRDGRLTRKDVEDALARRKSAPAHAKAPASVGGSEERGVRPGTLEDWAKVGCTGW